MQDTIAKPERVTKLQPPARWRNWWRCKLGISMECNECRSVVALEEGDMLQTCLCVRPYPSKEVAEIAASRPFGWWLDHFAYVGPFREGERP